jgi:hypothetical protein
MQIQLKQAEIVAAIRMYVAQQGISLVGKSVEMSFTAGRKEAGISVDIVIEDAQLFLSAEDMRTSEAPVLTLVQTTEAAPVVADVNAESPFVEDAPAEGEVAAEAAAPAGKSLFA